MEEEETADWFWYLWTSNSLTPFEIGIFSNSCTFLLDIVSKSGLGYRIEEKQLFFQICWHGRCHARPVSIQNSWSRIDTFILSERRNEYLYHEFGYKLSCFPRSIFRTEIVFCLTVKVINFNCSRYSNSSSLDYLNRCKYYLITKAILVRLCFMKIAFSSLFLSRESSLLVLLNKNSFSLFLSYSEMQS